MVLDKTKKLIVVSRVVAEMKPNALRVSMFQPVIQPLVITEIETLLLEFPFEIPVSLGDEEEIRMRLHYRRDHVHPIIGGGGCADVALPRALEDGVEQKHRHVAAQAIALGGDIINCFDHAPAQRRIK